MNRSELYGTHGKRADTCELSWELPEGLWPAEERRAIQPPPPALWRSVGAAARPVRALADLPVPPCAVGASPPLEPAPAWAPHVESFFSPRGTGAWARGAEPDSAPRRLPAPPLSIPIPPLPKVSSAPPRARESAARPSERARLMLRPEDERAVSASPERQLFGLPVRRLLRAGGAALLGAALIGMAIDWLPTDGAAKAPGRALSTAPRGAPRAGMHPEAQVGPPRSPTSLAAARSGSSPPARVGKRTFGHRARARRAERASDAKQTSAAGDAALPVEVQPAEVQPAELQPPEVQPAEVQPAVAPRAVTRAVLISSPRPQYPHLARQRGIGGSVVVRFKIDEHGVVRDAAIEHARPARVFDRAALQAIENTRYRPRIEDGEAVATPQARKRFTFHVRKTSQRSD
jgi:TonB family protein